jgi:carboxymethylenebutenolidase
MIVHSQTVFTEPHLVTPQGVLVRPADDRTYPGVVLIQEWWGFEPHIHDVAQRLARDGFVVLVPDLYHGEIANEPTDAQKLVMMMWDNVERVLKEVESSLEYLRRNAGVSPKKLGIMGFCMGGTVAFKMACRYPHLGAVSPWYGGRIDPNAEDLSMINAPIMAIYGELDAGIPLDRVAQLEKAVKDAGKEISVHVYKGAGHAFLNNTHGSYHDEAAKDAWDKAVSFLKQNLKPS